MPLDLVIIGSGPGGYRAAVLAALQGLQTAIVEKDVWGGCCLNRGCVPKKAWHDSARLLARQRHLAERGVLGALRPDLGRAWQHQRRVVERVRESYLDYLAHLKVARHAGHGRLDGPGRVVVGSKQGETVLETRHVILATGAVPALPAGLEAVPGRILTTDDLFQAPPPPGRRVALVGGGVIGTEFAFILRQLGLDLLWIAGGAPLRASDFSPSARQTLARALRESGAPDPLPARLAGARVGDDGVRLSLDDGSEHTVDWLLLGTGRRPVSEGLGLETAGIAPGADGFIPVDEHLRTGAPGVFAIGDCVGPAMTANQALADAAVAVHNIRHPDRPRTRPLREVPLAVYSAVELARLGLTEEQAEDEGFEPAVGFAAFATDPKALGEDDAEGYLRLLADMDEGTLLGAEAVGHGAGELIHLVSTRPDPESVLRELAHGRYNHPTRSEQWQNAAETLAAKWGLAGWLWDGE